MAYNKKALFEKVKEKIKTVGTVIFIEDVCDLVGISKPTFYKYFEVDSDEFNEIRDLISINRTKIKINLRADWYKNPNGTTGIALYRLCATPEEHQKLNQSYVDHTSGGEKINTNLPPIIIQVDEDK